MRVDRIGTLLFAGALVGAGFWGCGGDDTGTGGSGGGTTTSSSTTTTTTTTTTTVTSTTTGGGTSFLGLECTADGDCGADGKCIQVTDNDAVIGGGPAGGYCTKACAEDTDCPGQGSTCLVDANGAGECFLGCTFGDPALTNIGDALDQGKCHGREDLRCQELNDGSQVCLPTCGSDDQCDGRSCDPRLALCVDTPSTGKALGEACDPAAETTDCAGTCIGIGADFSMCTSPCVIGGEVLDTFDCGGPDKGLCIYAPSGTGVGDLAFCTKSCTVQDQCQAPSFFCIDIGLPDNGICLDSTPCNTTADCDFGSLDVACTETTLGKFCMSTLFPLGTLDPGAGTGGAGGTGGGSSSGTGGMGGAGGMMSGSSSSGM